MINSQCCRMCILLVAIDENQTVPSTQMSESSMTALKNGVTQRRKGRKEKRYHSALHFHSPWRARRAWTTALKIGRGLPRIKRQIRVILCKCASANSHRYWCRLPFRRGMLPDMNAATSTFTGKLEIRIALLCLSTD